MKSLSPDIINIFSNRLGVSDTTFTIVAIISSASAPFTCNTLYGKTSLISSRILFNVSNNSFQFRLD